MNQPVLDLTGAPPRQLTRDDRVYRALIDLAMTGADGEVFMQVCLSRQAVTKCAKAIRAKLRTFVENHNETTGDREFVLPNGAIIVVRNISF